MKTLYKFMRTGLKSDNGKDRDWKIGEWRSEKNIKICNSGFHASKTPLQALGYVKGEIIAQVEVKGESIIEDDKECWSDMRIVKAYHWKKEDSVALSIFAAELCIKNYEKVYPNDSRPRDAIEAAKKWLVEPTKANESAARSAESAARSAAWSAESAAESARSAKKKLVVSLDAWFLTRIKSLEEYV